MEKVFFEALGAAVGGVGTFFRSVAENIAANATVLAAILGVAVVALVLRSYLSGREDEQLPPTLLVPGWEPPNLGVEGIERLVVVRGHGRRAAQDFLAMTLFEQASERGVFTVDDWREQDVRLQLHGDRAELEGAGDDERAGDVYLQLDVVEWRVERDLLGDARVTRATVLLAATIVNDQGRVVVREHEYERSFTAQADVGRTELAERAASMAVGQLLDDLTPHLVDTPVELDLSDEAQVPALERARRGDLRGGIEAMEAYLEEEPDSASAHYNLGVLYDALGEHAAAFEAHEQALRLGPKPFYRRAALAGGEEKRQLVEAARATVRQRRVDQVLSDIAAAEDRNELLDVVLEFAAARLETTAIFVLQRKGQERVFVGWDVADARLDQDDIREVVVPLTEEGGLLAKVYELASPFLGPMSDDDPLVEMLGRTPTSCLAVPVVVGGQIACVIYGDCADKPVPQSVFVELQTILPAVGEGLREIIVVSMRRSAAPA